MPEDQIAQLVTETLAAVGLKVWATINIYKWCIKFLIKKDNECIKQMHPGSQLTMTMKIVLPTLKLLFALSFQDLLSHTHCTEMPSVVFCFDFWAK